MLTHSNIYSSSVTSLLPKKQYLIFIIENDRLYSFMLAYKLHLNPKYTIVSFSTGEACVENLQMKPDVIILDYNLSGINGIEVLKKIKAFNKYIQVILLSKYDGKEIVSEAFSKGVYDCLVKEQNSVKEVDRLIKKIIDSIHLKSSQEVGVFWKKALAVFFSLALVTTIAIQLFR